MSDPNFSESLVAAVSTEILNTPSLSESFKVTGAAITTTVLPTIETTSDLSQGEKQPLVHVIIGALVLGSVFAISLGCYCYKKS